MGTIYVKPGGSSADLDAVTATAGDVVKGKTFVDANANEVSGTLALTGSAVSGDILAGKTAYTTDPKTKVTGTLALSGNAQAAHVLAGETFYAADAKTKLTGTLTNQEAATWDSNVLFRDGAVVVEIPRAAYLSNGQSGSPEILVEPEMVANVMGVRTVVNFNVAFSGDKLVGSWGMPAKGPLTKVRVQYRTDGQYPTGTTDGTTLFDSWDMNQKTATGFSIVPPGGYGTYHIRAWCEVHYTNPDIWVSKQIWEGVVNAAPVLNTNPDWANNYAHKNSDGIRLSDATFYFVYNGQQYSTGTFSWSPGVNKGGATWTVTRTIYSALTSSTANKFRIALIGGTDYGYVTMKNLQAYVYLWKADDLSKYMRIGYKDITWSKGSPGSTRLNGTPTSSDIYISDPNFFLTDSIKNSKVAMCMRLNP